MTASTRKNAPVHVEPVSVGIEWVLDLAPPGAHAPIVSVGRFTTEAEAKTAAEVREGQALIWRGPDCTYKGLTAAGRLGIWLLLSEKTMVPLAATARGRPRRPPEVLLEKILSLHDRLVDRRPAEAPEQRIPKG